MGSALPNIIANFLMMFLEKKALDDTNLRLKIWFRHVNYFFIIHSLLVNMTSGHRKIQFTMKNQPAFNCRVTPSSITMHMKSLHITETLKQNSYNSNTIRKAF